MGDEIQKSLGKIHTSIAVIETDMKYVRKEIEGNGKKGLIKKVECLETDIDKFKGGFSTIKWLIALVGAAGVANFIMLFIK